jgi:histone acetyltransferase (RNA polymerase elongator complex component)
MAERGAYTPISEEDAIIRTAKILRYFDKKGVKVIRVGLCSSENLSNPDSYYAGPNHAALGELCENQVFYEIISEQIQKMKLSADSAVTVSVPKGSLSKAIGQKKKNKLRLISEFSLSDISFKENQTLKGYEVLCEERKV